MGKRDIEKSIKSFGEIISAIKLGAFSPYYLLMGEEPFYSDRIIEEISNGALSPDERGFNQMILYGSDADATKVIETARRFPMMASRQVVIVKEAQMMEGINDLEYYFRHPMPTTLLVIAMTNKSLDKRTSLYKSALENGVVFESMKLLDEMLFAWIEKYLKSKGYSISPEACMLMADYCGTELRKLVLELDKLTTNIQNSERRIETGDIELNIGISREYNVFELTKAISLKDTAKAYKIIKHFSASPRQFPLVLTLSAIFTHFSRLLKYHAAHSNGATPSRGELATTLGLNPYFLAEYDTAARNYPLIKCMEAISLIRRCDSASKSFMRGEAGDGELLFELVYKITH